MSEILAAIEAWPLIADLRTSRWVYAAVNGLHIFGIALLVGAIVPLDLKLLGAWTGVQKVDLARVLVPVAAAGLTITMVTGLLMLATRAREYAAIDIVLIKLALVATGAATALVFHLCYGLALAGASRRVSHAAAIVSLTCWLGALALGRAIGFVM
ncbi:MAG: DUF2214 domain-containing protein [Hyphomicrobiaceae bacterium]|nr:DUF2214 domain-containing protein [Hyphomicrobiaceae bacterium]